MLVAISCFVLSGLPVRGNAAGLGRIVVFSALGQPLRAEIEITATPEEFQGMKARLASPDVFKQANVDYATTLLGIGFRLDKRSNGQSIIKLVSDKPINAPFVDVLLELDWPSGRLIREYTFLLDPDELAAKKVVSIAPAKAPKSTQVGNSPAMTMHSTSAIDDELRSRAIAKVDAQELSQKTLEQPTERLQFHEVRRGDTVRKIASETKPEDVSLEQMLIGLWQANQKAFDGGNMNRLKAGKTLSIPEESALKAISTKDAKKIVLTQAAEWNVYRLKLSTDAALGPAKDDVYRQDAVGKITTKVEDMVAPVVEPKDQVKISKSGTVRAKAKYSEEDLIAQDKALQEANDRVSSLEINIANTQKLIELKNQQLAALQKSIVANEAASEAPANLEHVTAPSPATSAIAEKSTAMWSNQQKPKSEEKTNPKQNIPPKPMREASLVEKFLGSPLALVGGGMALLVLLAGYFLYKRRS